MTFAPQMPDEPYPQTTTRPTRVTEAAAHSKRTRGEDPVPAPSHSTKNVPPDFRTINGWGADLDPKDRPAVPRELPSDVMTARGDVKHWQTPRTKIHQSNEHPDLTPVFGESCPPHGLSGVLRDYAYQYGEASNRHWLTLMLADRVDVFESLIGGVLRGKPDRYIKEKGWSAKLKYDSEARRRTLIIGAAVVGALAVGVVLSKTLSDD
jgi:hypothetical protein